jgi:hypothetical protein
MQRQPALVVAGPGASSISWQLLLCFIVLCCSILHHIPFHCALGVLLSNAASRIIYCV